MPELNEHIIKLILLLRLPSNWVKFNEVIVADPDLRDQVVAVFCDGVKYKTATDIQKSINTLRNNILDRMIDTFSPPQAGYRMAAICADMVDGPQNLKDNIGELVSQRFFSRRQEIDSIMALMSLMGIEDQSTVEPNHHAGVNHGFIVSMGDGSKKFVKNFANESVMAGKIDPNELLAYKILQYLNLGPLTEFLIHQYSIGRGTAIFGNFIVTDDINTNGWTFYLDNAEHRDLFLAALSTSVTANVELSLLSTVNDVLLLGDTFGENPGNYGLLHRTDANGYDEFRFMAVDHLPHTNNATFPPYRFALGEAYSPRASVQKRVNCARYQQRVGDVALHGQRGLDQPPIELGRAAYPREQILSAVNARLADLPAAVDGALNDVLEEIDSYERSFCTDARARVRSYVEVIHDNFEKLRMM